MTKRLTKKPVPESVCCSTSWRMHRQRPPSTPYPPVLCPSNCTQLPGKACAAGHVASAAGHRSSGSPSRRSPQRTLPLCSLPRTLPWLCRGTICNISTSCILCRLLCDGKLFKVSLVPLQWLGMWRSSHSNSTTFEHRTFSADSKFVYFFHVPVVEFEPQIYTIGTTCLRPPVTGTTNWTNARCLIVWKNRK